MKKFIFVLVLLPFFASAQEYNNTTEGVYQSQPEQQQVMTDSDVETMGRWHRVRCGGNSDYKCQGRYVYEACEKDNSHGINGSCRNYNNSGSEVLCRCF
ncbi:hypothetical protein D3C72_1272080 [compost metagenome]